jgi:hypothetical protein
MAVGWGMDTNTASRQLLIFPLWLPTSGFAGARGYDTDVIVQPGTAQVSLELGLSGPRARSCQPDHYRLQRPGLKPVQLV